MNDLLFVGVFAAFMVASFGYIRLCDRIVRADRSEQAPGEPRSHIAVDLPETVAS